MPLRKTPSGGVFYWGRKDKRRLIRKSIDSLIPKAYKYYGVILHSNIVGFGEKMGYDYNQTHAKILKSAEEHFANEGFRGASIRLICKDAGVTNGAFYAHFKSKDDLYVEIVQPYVDGLTELYTKESDRYFVIKSEEDVIEAFRKAYSSIDRIITYLCDNREIFRLLLESSDGTVYENYAKEIIEAETQSMAKFLKKSRGYVKNLEKISENIIKTGSAMMIGTIFDGVKKGKEPDEILKESALVSEFCIAGYKHILGI